MFEIDDKLFGYISKGNDLDENIIQRYKNSLIFIGDEKQIYIPTTNSYVGVGLSYLNDRLKNSDKLYIKNEANNNTTYYFPVISGTTPNTYYYTYVASNVGINPNKGKFIGGLEGTADYSNVSNVTHKNEIKTTSNNSTYYITFSNKTSGNSYTYVNSNLQYNPNTNILITTTFKGNLDGNAKTATNATNSTYAIYGTYAIYLNGLRSDDLFTDFDNDDDETFIVVGGTRKTNYVNAAYLQGYHANQLLTYFKSGTISSKNNTLSQANTYIKVGGTSYYANGSSCSIINSATWAYVYSGTYIPNTTYNLVLRYSVNGVNSSYTYIPKIYAYSATYLNGLRPNDLFTDFDNDDDETFIVIGGTRKTNYVNAAYLQGYHANQLLTYFKSGTISSKNNTLSQANTYIKVGGTSYYANGSSCNIINAHTANGGQLTSSVNTMSLSAHSDSVNGVSASTTASSATIINTHTANGGQLSSLGNTMSLSAHSDSVNGVSASTAESTADIINSLSVSTFTSTYTTNLTAAITINGVASTNKSITDLIARQIAQTSITDLSTFTNANNLIYGAVGGSNSVSDKPTGVDAFGVLSFKTANGSYGQLLMSSNKSTGIYWRTATSLSSDWKKLLDSTNYTDYVYSKSSADNRYVLKAGDTMTGTLTVKTTGTGSYDQGIRINRTATNKWALLLIGKSEDATSGTGTSTAGDGAWLIGTPPSSNSLIFNLNSCSESVGLCLKGHGDNDIKWNDNNVAHAGNISNKDATIGTSLTEIATIAGVSIKANIGSYASSDHLHDDRYVKLDAGDNEQTIKNSISSLSHGSIEIWRATFGGYPMIGFSNGTTKTLLGLLGFTATANEPIFRTTGNINYKLAHAGNIDNKSASLGTTNTVIATIAGVNIEAKVGVTDNGASILTTSTTLATVAGQDITAKVGVTDNGASITTSATTLATIAGQDITAKIAVSNKNATIGTSLTEIATIAGVSIKANIGSYASSSHTHKVTIHNIEKIIPASGSVELGDYVYLNGDSMTGHLKMDGTKDLNSAWDKGIIAGADGHDKTVLTYLASSTNGAVIGARNSALSDWANLNISGTQLIFRSSQTEKMRMNSSGNLGIGTSSPSEKLHVVGNVRVTGDEYIGTGTGSQCHMQYDNTNKCLNFIFD